MEFAGLKISSLYKLKKIIYLSGETGTGKSTLARLIHLGSDRKDLPFVTVDLAAINENLIESELFGHIKGSFTGAITNRDGFLDRVNGGTLFLDEIGELNLSLQKKLLRMIETKEYYPVGSSKLKKFTGTIIVATHIDLKEAVAKGNFRKDLFYRINLFKFALSPLRNNPKIFHKSFIKILNDLKLEYQNFKISFSFEAVKKLQNYSWDGNFRELKNVLEFLVINYAREIQVADISCVDFDDYEEYTGSEFHNAVAMFEKKYLEQKLLEYGGKINYSAKQLGISKTTLISKVEKYAININKIKIAYKKGAVIGL